ncbi:MAG: hypothetical protein AAF721_03670 [Myxococcota bacterium]
MKTENHPHRPNCPHCHAKGSVRTPHPAWRVALVAGWLVAAAMVMGISLIGPFILLLGPIVAASGAGLLSFLHGKVAEPPICEACGKITQPLAAARRVTRMPAVQHQPA